DGRFMVRLENGEAFLLGPVPRPRRALARLASERIALAAEAAIQRSADARPRGPARATALTALLLGTEADAPRAAAALGLAASGVYRVALASPEMEQATLQRTMATFGAAHEAAAIDRAHAALIEVRPESVATGGAGGRSTTVRRRDAAGRDGSPAMSGWLALSSPVVGVAGLPAAAREARFTAALVVSGSAAGPVAKFDSLNDLGPHQLLYRLWGTPDLARFAADALGELPARDRRGTLRHTLLTYLQTGGSHVDAAARLGIHRNTLSYRLKQIAALTGREPTDPATQLVSHLALLASSLPPAP
ncbi:MAG: PucR family transcriptional regulator, partial [Thermomicrobiales bacterium]